MVASDGDDTTSQGGSERSLSESLEDRRTSGHSLIRAVAREALEGPPKLKGRFIAKSPRGLLKAVAREADDIETPVRERLNKRRQS